MNAERWFRFCRIGDRMVNVLNMDVVAGLATLEAESVNCVVTSPPYWGLRDYGTGTWEGGDAACDHQVPTLPSRNFLNGRGTGGGCKSWTTRDCSTFLNICGKCGARRVDRQIGLESTVEEYVEKMVAVFREVRRVLRADGTCWVNMGDCYGAGTNNPTSFRRDRAQVCHRRGKDCDPKRGMAAAESPLHHAVGLKPKDLVGLPWRVAFALQADGWWLRSDIVWHKPNPMPESVTDRPTRAHEYLFLLTKSARYWYDADAIKEPASADTHARYARGRSDNHKWADGGPGNQTIAKTLEHMARKNGEERTERTTGTARTNGEGVNPKCYKGSSFTKGKTGAVHANVGQGPRRSYVKQNPSFS
ncbi:MAG: site-specific DNA-methyltransferase, partial [Candidatus Hydrogenedentes bacterium]|nr:site-specific DNA-methyltransferase [Candidatus Hydrogenedentota bacterium]